MAIPKDLEDWIRAPAVGEKREIKLLFEEGETKATLRRIANARGHVQIKYETRDAVGFREWLKKIFASTVTGMEGEYLELVRVEGDTFRVNAFPLSRQPRRRLVVAEWIFHRTTDRAFQTYGPIREIPAIVQSVEFSATEGQSFYNRQLSHLFGEWKWEAERRVIPSLPLKSDFMKGAVQVEVEFGNARTYYQDYIKFMLAFNQKAAEVGVLVVPTVEFARTLCEVGRKKAVAKGRHSYSGMIHIDKVRRELGYLAFMLSMPLAIAGIGLQRLRSL
jgi:hypothetical protein